MTMGPKCLRCSKCLMFMLSGSVKFLFLKCFIACVISAAVVIIVVGVSDLVSLLIILYVGLEECVVADLKYLFSMLAFLCRCRLFCCCVGEGGDLFWVVEPLMFSIKRGIFSCGPSLLLSGFPIFCSWMRCG